MNRGHRPPQSGFRALAVPGPQGAHRLAPRVFGLVVQRLRQQLINAGRQFGGGGCAVLDQKLQGAGADFARLGAQGEFGEVDIARRAFQFGQLEQTIESVGADLGVVVVQQPLQARAQTRIAR